MIDDNAVDNIRGIVDFNSCVEYTESYVKFQSSMRTDKESWIAMNALIAHNLHATGVQISWTIIVQGNFRSFGAPPAKSKVERFVTPTGG
jgi:hypothetical protein